MPSFRPLRLILVLLAVGEIMSLVWLGKSFGLLATLLVLIVAAFVGASLIRRSGFGLARLISGPRPGAEELSEGAAKSLLGGMAGLLFFMPGLVSDLVAVLLLLPFTRRWLARFIPLNGFVFTPWSATPSSRSGTVIEGEAVEIIEPDRRVN